MDTVLWSEWQPLSPAMQRGAIPNQPGIYEVRTDFEVHRLNGSSRTISIGSAVPSLRRRLLGERVRNPGRYLNRAEKWLLLAGHDLEYHYAVSPDGDTARRWEAECLWEYEKLHWELPPGNEVLPKKYLGTESKEELAKAMWGSRDVYWQTMANRRG